MAGEHASDEAAVERQDLLSRFRRGWPWIVCATMAGVLGSAVFVAVVPPRYAGLAVIVPAEPPRSSISMPGAPDDAEARAQSLASLDVAHAAIDRLQLAQHPEFRSGDAADRFLSRLSVRPVAGSRAVTITFEARNPELAARAANTVAELAVLSLNEARARSLRAVETWVETKIEDARAKAALAEAKVEAARPEPASAPEAERQDDLGARLSAARAAEAAASARAAELRNLMQAGRLADAPPSIVDDPLRRLVDQRASLRAEIAEASRTLLPLHPRMKDLAAQLAGLDGQIRDAAERDARASEGNARRAADEAETLAAALAESSKAPTPAPAPAALHAAEVEAQTAREELASYQQMAREEQARAAAETESGAARILARAETPRAPIFPKAAPTLLAGAGAGLALGCLLAGLAAARRRPDLSAPPAPATPEGPPTFAPGTDPSARLELIEPVTPAAPGGGLDDVAVLVETVRRLKPKDKTVVLVAGDDTGRALAVALEAARRLAAERAAVLVDLGETQDWLADILYREDWEGLDPPAIAGLSDLLAGRAGFGEVIRRDLSSTLDVVLPGSERVNGGLDDALTAFAGAYGAVVLHASDWRSDRARAASPFADAVAVVAPAARAEAAREAAAFSLGDLSPTVLAFPVRAARRTAEPVS